MKIPSSEHVLYVNCSDWQNEHKKNQFLYTSCFDFGIYIYWTCNSMNNFVSYYGLVDARISASDKVLPVR